MLGSREDDGGHAAAALASAFECLQDADKVRAIVLLADVLQCLGVKFRQIYYNKTVQK